MDQTFKKLDLVLAQVLTSAKVAHPLWGKAGYQIESLNWP